MKYRKLGNTDLDVSVICLGTMTYGQQNNESEGHEQMDFAVSKDVNFFDTAEMYSIPSKPETQGSTERIIGSWFKKTGMREKIILASKVTGPGKAFSHISDNLGFSRARILDAIDKSLTRLQTDYIDLYQLHFPERKTNYFGVLGYEYDENEKWVDNFEEAIATLGELISVGKIRHWGLSNETPWGVMRVCQVCDKLNIERPQSIQNPYSLINRSYEVGLAEMSIRENIGLLAYSPLGFGRLTGKFEKGQDKPTDRLNLFKNYVRYNKPAAIEATIQYIKIAEEAGLSTTQMALAFVNGRPFLTSTIIGATNLNQLNENITSIDIDLDSVLIKAINDVHEVISNPAP